MTPTGNVRWKGIGLGRSSAPVFRDEAGDRWVLEQELSPDPGEEPGNDWIEVDSIE